MQIPLVNILKQYNSIKPEITQAISSVCESGNFILGEEVEKFEKEFAAYCQVKYAVGVGSGFDALLLIMRAFNIGKGDEVITVSNTFISTILPIIYVGATPVFVDIDPETKSMNTQLLKKAITPKTRAILPVHLFGYPADIDAIKTIIGKRKIFIIEDAAQAQGSQYKGKMCGGLGDVAAFSFYAGKNLGAYGEAGAVVSNNKKLINTIKILRDVGQNKKYKHSLLGYNSRLDTLQAAILRVKLRYLDTWNERRRQHARRYNALLSDSVTLPVYNEDYNTNYHIFCIELNKRDKLFEYLKQKGIFCGIHYPIPIHLQPCMKGINYKKYDLPVTENKAKKIISLPMFAELKDEEISYICQQISKFLKK